jgi:hypothetical protein
VSLADWRDVVIIIMGLMTAVFFLFSAIFAVILGLLSRGLLRRSINLIDDDVKPILGKAKESATNVAGTTAYVSEAAVTPIVRTYGIVAGVRRAAAVIAGLTGARTQRGE